MEQERIDELERLKKKIQKLEKNKKVKAKSKRLLSKIGNFQEKLGKSVAPMRKIFSYITVFILFVAGLVLISLGASDKNKDDSHTYLVVGGFLLVGAVILLVRTYYWYKIVGESSTAAKMEGFFFEAGIIEGLLGR
jgi:hypothetical protein